MSIGRDMDTFRPIIAPPSRSDEYYDDAPRTARWVGLAVVMGALLGALIVGWAWIEDHPEVSRAAREGTTAAAKPVKTTSALGAPSASAAPPASIAPQAEQRGFIAIGGPKGARVFDGDKLVGTAPILHATSAGTHVIRVQQGATAAANNTQTFNVDVRAFETSPVIVTPVDASKARGKRSALPPATKKTRR